MIKVAGSKKFSKIASTTSTKGAYIVSLLGKGSAYFAPSQGVFTIVRAIAKAKRQKFYTSCYLKGEYGLKELCIGVPVIIGKNGIEKIVKLSLDEPEKIKLDECANTIRDTIKSLKI